MKKQNIYWIISAVLLVGICSMLIWGLFTKKEIFCTSSPQEEEQIDLDTVYLVGSGVQVDYLDNLQKENVIVDHKEETITIRIGHAYLQAIEVDPNKIIIDKAKQSLLARGDVQLTVSDYNQIEKDIRSRLEEEFDTAENGQEADVVALQMVHDIYAPIIKAIDSSYHLYVEFE